MCVYVCMCCISGAHPHVNASCLHIHDMQSEVKATRAAYRVRNMCVRVCVCV